MKKSFKLLSFLSLFLILGLSSCGDECDDVNCLNGATCNDGNCACVAGYEGDVCQTEQRARFIGAYNVTESCQGQNDNFQMSITTSSTGVRNVIILFPGFSISASTDGNALTIPNQTVNVQGTALTFSGSGQLTGTILTMTYTIAAGNASNTCTATCTKL